MYNVHAFYYQVQFTVKIIDSFDASHSIFTNLINIYQHANELIYTKASVARTKHLNQTVLNVLSITNLKSLVMFCLYLVFVKKSRVQCFGIFLLID